MCCNKKHSMYPNLRCVKEKDHEGWCGCAPTDESRLISSCNEFLSELKRYECTEDIDYDVFIAMSSTENLLGLLKKKEKEQAED